ncbi:hypothetical protein CEXT_636381 [Caerostris extrusa]|uniref:Uncharacterized protein n=1 Tax=Caerostris extrusa TaxID=172846 RepID=A0AAV4WUQ4_CAEEX|nr:hypothetical protein CEXT_636381 [Caerostris extrusa]
MGLAATDICCFCDRAHDYLQSHLASIGLAAQILTPFATIAAQTTYRDCIEKDWLLKISNCDHSVAHDYLQSPLLNVSRSLPPLRP